MKRTSDPIVFFGSGPVAAKSLELLNNDFTIEAVVTKPRPVHHKGAVPVLGITEKLNLPVFTAQNSSELDALFGQKPFKSRIAILVDFGIIVSKKIIEYFPLGIINSHFSLLPALRGADPISFAILRGLKETGVSLMMLVEAMDEGPLLAQAPFQLPDDITTPELTEILTEISYKTLKEIVPRYITDEVEPIPQPTKGVSYSRRLTKEDGVLNWEKPADVLEHEIRAFIEWPKSRTILGDKEVVITKADAVPSVAPGTNPGDITVVKDAGAIAVTTKNGSLWIQRLKPSSKREMSASEFLAGNKL